MDDNVWHDSKWYSKDDADQLMQLVNNEKCAKKCSEECIRSYSRESSQWCLQVHDSEMSWLERAYSYWIGIDNWMLKHYQLSYCCWGRAVVRAAATDDDELLLSWWYSTMHRWHDHDPSGGSDNGGFKQYMWYPRSQSSQNSSWSCQTNKHVTNTVKERVTLTSLSEVPQRPQDLHSIHCHRYFFTDSIIFAVNWRQEGWADRPQSEHETKISAELVFLFSPESPRQKSQ